MSEIGSRRPTPEQANLAVVEAYWRAWNDKRLSDAADAIATDARFRHFTLGIEVHGRQAILDLMEKSLAMLPERRSTVVHSLAADDHVITENRYEARTESGQPLTKDICYVFRLDDGQIVEWREYG